jgi:hypothetical protein
MVRPAAIPSRVATRENSHGSSNSYYYRVLAAENEAKAAVAKAFRGELVEPQPTVDTKKVVSQ